MRVSATVNEQAGLSWPGATVPWEHFRVTGRSTLRPLEPAGPCLLWDPGDVRGECPGGDYASHARATDAGLSVARLAELAGYAKRNVADECDMLELAVS